METVGEYLRSSGLTHQKLDEILAREDFLLSQAKKLYNYFPEWNVKEIEFTPFSHDKYVQDSLLTKPLTYEFLDYMIHYAFWYSELYGKSVLYSFMETLYKRHWPDWLKGILSENIIFTSISFLPLSDQYGYGNLNGDMNIYITDTFFKYDSKVSGYGFLWIYIQYQENTMVFDINQFSEYLSDPFINIIVFPIYIIISDTVSHLNILLIDKINLTIEHFEPYELDSKVSDLLQENLINPFFESWNYLPAEKTCPIIFKGRGPQFFNESIHDNGYCSIWNIYYMKMRIMNPDKSPHEIFIFMTSSPGILNEIRRFKCYVLDMCYQSLIHGLIDDDHVKNIILEQVDELNKCKH